MNLSEYITSEFGIVPDDVQLKQIREKSKEKSEFTQEQLDFFIEGWCLTAQESLGDFELEVFEWSDKVFHIGICNTEIENIELPFEYIKDHYTPKEKAKIVISLLEQIIENGEEWLRDEEN